MVEKAPVPEIVRVLISVGGLLILSSGFIAVLGYPIGFTFMGGHMMWEVLPGVSPYHGVIEMISGIIILLVAFFANVNDRNSAQILSMVALIFSLVSLIGGGGFLIGSVLAFVGSVFGLGYWYVSAIRPPYAAPRVKKAAQRSGTGKPAAAGKLKMLKPDERKLYDIVKQSDGAIFQAELVEKSGFSKVRVSRLLDGLEGRGFIERRRRGMTNIVILRNGENAQQQAF